MTAHAEILSQALHTEAELEAGEDRLSTERGVQIREQLAAMEQNDDIEMKRLAEEIEQLTERRRAVRR